MRTRPPTLTWLLGILAAALALLGTALAVTPATAASAADPAPSITGIAARSGPLAGGDLVTIRGYHLSGTTSVLFGSTPTSTDLQVISDTHVQVRTPAHAAGGNYVQVVRADATSPRNAVATYVFVAAPAPLRFGPLHSRPGLGADLACASANLCASIGVVRQSHPGSYVFGAVVKNGSSWGRAKEFSHYGVNGVSCTLAPRRMCMTVGIDGYASRYDGRVWHRTRVAPASYDDPLVDVSCATSSFCQAISTDGLAYRWNGTRWSGATHVADARLFSVSCPRTTFCYAVGETGVRWIGSRWVAAHTIIPTGTASSISCSSPTFCMAGGRFPGGNRLIFTGVAWSPPNHDHYDFEGMNQTPVTCTGPTFCVNPNGDFETDYHFATYNGDVVNQDQEFGTEISCWAAYRCMTTSGSQWRYVTKGP